MPEPFVRSICHPYSTRVASTGPKASLSMSNLNTEIHSETRVLGLPSGRLITSAAPLRLGRDSELPTSANAFVEMLSLTPGFQKANP